LDSDSEDEELKELDIDVNFIDEKSSAVHCLGNMFMFAPSLLAPQLDEILKHLGEVAFFFHENIRLQAVQTYS